MDKILYVIWCVIWGLIFASMCDQDRKTHILEKIIIAIIWIFMVVSTIKKEKKEANNERMVTIDYEYSEEDIMKANEIYEKIIAAMIKQDLESEDFVELNGEKIPYNEENQE